MNYKHIVPAVFVERPNRFIAWADVNGTLVKCHVKNTGRCKELLLPGSHILLEHHPDALALGRKTEYSLVQVYKSMSHGTQLINMDSQAPNAVAADWLANGGLPHVSEIRREVSYGNSRFDLSFLQNKIPSFMEVKGVTLEQEGIARFPDAPTLRGIKHLKELELAASAGYQAYVLFVIAMKGITHFEANRVTHPAFCDALSHAAAHGVTVLAYDSIITPDSFALDAPVPVVLV